MEYIYILLGFLGGIVFLILVLVSLFISMVNFDKMKFNDAANDFVKNNSFMTAMKSENNFKRTENGAIAKKSTLSKVYNLFALGGAYRKRSDEDCILLFKEAYEEDKNYALKCLWYLRDILEGKLVA